MKFFNKKIKRIIIIISVIIIILVLVYGVIKLQHLKKDKIDNVDNMEKVEESLQNEMPPPPPEEKEPMKPIADKKIENDCEISSEKIECNENNKNALYILNKANVKANNLEINKSGIVDHFSDSDFYGINAAIFVEEGILNINNSKIYSNGNGANAIFVKGYNSKVNINDIQIVTYGNRTRGIDALDKATIEGENISITTHGNKSSAVTTDRGNGNIDLKNVNIETNGTDSVGIYSTGNIKISDSKINAKNSEVCVVEGTNNLELINVDMNAAKKRGIMIMSSMPNEMHLSGNLNMLNGTLNVAEGPAFYVTNNKAQIILENVKISTVSNIFVDASKNTDGELNQEGVFKNLKGGFVEIIAKNQNIEGNMVVDATSSIDIKLSDNSYYKGILNPEKTQGLVNINCDNTSIIELTGDSYINDLKFNDTLTIKSNGYNLFYKNLSGQKENILINGKGKLIENNN